MVAPLTGRALSGKLTPGHHHAEDAVATAWKNKLYFGDNLTVLGEHVPDESVDLVYLDPPFNSNATYNVLFRETSGAESTAQITAFEDTWHWASTACCTEPSDDLGPASLIAL